MGRIRVRSARIEKSLLGRHAYPDQFVAEYHDPIQYSIEAQARHGQNALGIKLPIFASVNFFATE